MSVRTPDNPDETVSQPILSWLAQAPNKDIEADIARLQAYVQLLSETSASLAPAQMQRLLTMLQERADHVARAAVRKLEKTHLPLSGRVRNLVKILQTALEGLATLYFAEVSGQERLVKGLQRPPEASLWLALNCLRRHLMLSNRSASPQGAGIWRLVHQINASATSAKLLDLTPHGGNCTLATLHARILLIGCPHPASFAAIEWRFVEAYLARYAGEVTVSAEPPRGEHGGFWINPEQDSQPVAIARKQVPQGSPALYIDPKALDDRILRHLHALQSGQTFRVTSLPTDLSPSATASVLKRLASIFVRPAKRRFNRRKQSYRARICFRLDAIWQLLRGQRDDTELSEWQVVNESPDGYAGMHVSGRTQKMQVGDLAAIRRYQDEDWQICVVRWALSENPEHFEVGLQALAPSAKPRLLATPGPKDIEKQPALLMPPVAGQRNENSLAIAPGLPIDASARQVLISEDNNLVITEVRLSEVLESTPGVDIYLVSEARDS